MKASAVQVLGKLSIFCPGCDYCLQNDCYFFKCTYIPGLSRTDWAQCLNQEAAE